MDGPQDLMDAFNGKWGVLAWGNPNTVKDMLRGILQRSAAQLVTPADPCVIESMMYGCRVAEVTIIFLTSDTMQQVCVAQQEERAFVADHFAVYLGADTERRRQEAAAPPQPAPVPQGPPPLPPVWPPPLAGPWQPPESQGPAPSRRAHLSPGPGAGRAPSAAVPSPGGAAAAGDPLPPPASGSARAFPPPLARFLPGGPPDPLLEAWNSAEPPPGLRPCPSGTVARKVARGRGVSARANPYQDYRVQGQG